MAQNTVFIDVLSGTEKVGSVWHEGPGNWASEHDASGNTHDMHDTKKLAIDHVLEQHRNVA